MVQIKIISWQCICTNKFDRIFQMTSLLYIFSNLCYYLKSRLPSWSKRDISVNYCAHRHNIDFDRRIALFFLMFIKYFGYFILIYVGYGFRLFSIYQYFNCGTNILKTVHLRVLFLLIDAVWFGKMTCRNWPFNWFFTLLHQICKFFTK